MNLWRIRLIAVSIIMLLTFWMGGNGWTEPPEPTDTPTNTPTSANTPTPKTTPVAAIWQHKEWPINQSYGNEQDDVDLGSYADAYKVFWKRHQGDHLGHRVRRADFGTTQLVSPVSWSRDSEWWQYSPALTIDGNWDNCCTTWGLAYNSWSSSFYVTMPEGGISGERVRIKLRSSDKDDIQNDQPSSFYLRAKWDGSDTIHYVAQNLTVDGLEDLYLTLDSGVSHYVTWIQIFFQNDQHETQGDTRYRVYEIAVEEKPDFEEVSRTIQLVNAQGTPLTPTPWQSPANQYWYFPVQDRTPGNHYNWEVFALNGEGTPVAPGTNDYADPPTPVWKGGLEFFTPTPTNSPTPTCTPIPVVSLSVAESYVLESAGKVYVWVAVDRVADTTVSVSYSTSDGAAESGIDYTGVDDTLYFYGQSTRVIAIDIIDDDNVEGDLDFTLNLDSGSGVILGSSIEQKITILEDDDGLPSFVDVDIEKVYIPPCGEMNSTRIWVGSTTGMQFGDNQDSHCTFTGEHEEGLAGWAVDGVGDVNGDGYEDFVIGAPAAENFQQTENGPGWVYLILGKPKEKWNMESWDFSSPTSLSEADAVFVGEDDSTGYYDGAGWSVAGVGDVNGDGYNDFVIGARFNDLGGSNAGQVYLIFGRPDWSQWNGDSDLSNADAFFVGESAGDYAGKEVIGAGDVDGNGYDDFIIGAPSNSDGGTYAGQAYLILGGPDWSDWDDDPVRADLSNADAFFVGESGNDNAGNNMSAVGDVNGDGFDDFAIGANVRNNLKGETYLILGRSDWSDWDDDPEREDLSNADGFFVGEYIYDQSASGVSGVGDVNQDGYDDFIIGAAHNDQGGQNAGQVYLILGDSNWSSWNDKYNRKDLSYADEFFIGLCCTQGAAGYEVNGVGDYNADGYSDFIIGAPHDSTTAAVTGRVYLVYGRSDEDWEDWGESGRERLEYDSFFVGGSAWEFAGTDVSGVGDADGDGLADLIMGAAKANIEENDRAGKAYLAFGEKLVSVDDPSYVTHVRPGDAGEKGIGLAGDGANTIPASRCWMDYSGGQGAGGSSDASLEEVKLTRNSSGISNIPSGLTPAEVQWKIISERRDPANPITAKVKFHYLDQEVEKIQLDESELLIYKATSQSGEWVVLSNLSRDTARNEISGEFTIPSGGSGYTLYFALASTKLPDSPENLTAVVEGTTVTLDWDDVSGVSGYNVYRSTRLKGPYTKINDSVVGVSEYTDSNLIRGPRYYYRVTSVGSESLPSSVSEGTPMRYIVVDAGHGFHTGTEGRHSFLWGEIIWEGDLTFYLAKGHPDIRGIGFFVDSSYDRAQVIYTRESIYYGPQIAERPKKAYDYGAQLFLSIHFDYIDLPDEDQPNLTKSLVYPVDNPADYPGGEQDPLFIGNYDQYNLGEDIAFGSAIALAAYESWSIPGISYGGVRSVYTDEEGNVDINKGHWGVLRDSALWRKFEPYDPIPRIPAAIIEVNFIRNEQFHLIWNEFPCIPAREAVAEGIARALIEQLDGIK